VTDQWTLPELVSEVATRIEALPTPANGQVRAVPDVRTIRYYGTIGLLDRPLAMRGRTALYGPKHLAQVVAIKRLQHAGKSLAEIHALWPTLDADRLARMSGVALPADTPRATRAGFWKDEPADQVVEPAPREPRGPITRIAFGPPATPAGQPLEDSGHVRSDRRASRDLEHRLEHRLELRLELAPEITLALSVTDDGASISPADVRAIRAAAAPLLAELANRGLAPHPPRGEGE
jgi:DNA-binding transcriptional MerR regulator